MKHHHSSAITITQQDVGRLSAMVSLYQDVEDAATTALQEELDRANVVAQGAVAPDVVTMNSRIVCHGDGSAAREVEIVYPWHADASAGRISVLAPLGRALLGAAVGDTIEVTARGRARTWTIASIEYQPESSGHFEL